MTLLVIQVAILVFLAVAGTAVVLTRDPRNQVIGLSFYGLLLAVAFFIYQAPDVALSQIVIGAVALPLMFMLALTKVRRDQQEREFFEQRESGKARRENPPEAA